MIDVAQLDRDIAFLRAEAQRLRDRAGGQKWAERNAAAFESIAETLRQVRQDRQMTTLGGRRLSDNGE